VEEDFEQPQDEPPTEEAPKRFSSNIFQDMQSGNGYLVSDLDSL